MQRKRIFSRAVFGILTGLIFCGACWIYSAAAQAPQARQEKAAPPSSAPTTPGAESGSPLTADDLATFVDGFMPGELERDDIPGAVLVIVKDGQVLYQRGFGYADVKNKKPVTVDGTLFRPGSVSKTFTCTAVMQLVEQNKLDLDRDVNDYLEFKIPATYSQPVTLRRIMTHTAGFEEWGKALFVGSPADIEPPPIYLQEYMPARVFAPGSMPAYSNYGMSLAGYIVQRVSGEKFEDYIDNHILKPMGMTHSTFRQPLPPDLAPLMSNGYQHGSSKPKDFEYVNGVPAGSMSVSGADMARWAIMHLQDGKYGDVQILGAQTAKLMHSRAFGPVPQLNGMALCFFQENRNGHTIVGHGGDTMYFHSHLSLILDANVGMFISLNSAGRGIAEGVDVRKLFWNKFLDRYFPGAPSLPEAVATAKEDSKAVSGVYITSRRSETTLGKLGSVLGEAEYEAQPDGTLVSQNSKGLNGVPKHWREIAPMVYRDENSQDKIGFKKNDAGRWDIFSDSAASGFQQVTFLNSKCLATSLMYFFLGTLGLAVLLWPIAALVRRHYERPLQLDSFDRFLRTLVRVVCVIDLAVFWGWMRLSDYLSGDIGRATYHADIYINILHVFEWLGILGTLLALWYAYRTWMSASRWGWSKLFEVFVVLGCIAFFWFCYMGNMLHFSLRY